MKQAATIVVLLALAAASNAEPAQFINGDGTEVTDLCIAAATGAPDLNTRAVRLGVRNFTDDDVLCNGMPLNEFMRKYRTEAANETIVTSLRDGKVPVMASTQP